jgi:hypothetical protein
MNEQESSLYCDMVARGDFVAADLFMRACLARRNAAGVRECPSCGGMGIRDGIGDTCPKCDGAGVSETSDAAQPQGNSNVGTSEL